MLSDATVMLGSKWSSRENGQFTRPYKASRSAGDPWLSRGIDVVEDRAKRENGKLRQEAPQIFRI